MKEKVPKASYVKVYRRLLLSRLGVLNVRVSARVYSICTLCDTFTSSFTSLSPQNFSISQFCCVSLVLLSAKITTSFHFYRVLIFPPVNNYRRFLIHQLIQDKFDELHTFSIGQSLDRRTVVCYKSDFRHRELNGAAPSSDKSGVESSASSNMGVERPCSPAASSENPRQRQVKTTPAVEIYRPPAARRINKTAPSASAVPDSCTIRPKIRRPDRAVYVPKARRSIETEASSSALDDCSNYEKPNELEAVKTKETDKPASTENGGSVAVVEDEDKKHGLKEDIETIETILTTNQSDSSNDGHYNSHFSSEKKYIPVEAVDETDVLIISSSDAQPQETPLPREPEKKAKKISRSKSKPASPPSPAVKINRDECDWDSLFDDNGESLDPTLFEELTASVGQVSIEQPKNEYKAFSRSIEVSSDEFGHVIEIYNFPSEFKTSDLAAVFTPWKNGGFELKWVDDTHCLGVFSSPLVAAEVLASDHPFVKTRRLSEATTLSRMKARKSAEFLQPYKSRPETCAALARRLVTGALGVRLATARQEREHEKVLLREAKERRRLANKQREDIWEGIIDHKS